MTSEWIVIFVAIYFIIEIIWAGGWISVQQTIKCLHGTLEINRTFSQQHLCLIHYAHNDFGSQKIVHYRSSFNLYFGTGLLNFDTNHSLSWESVFIRHLNVTRRWHLHKQVFFIPQLNVIHKQDMAENAYMYYITT